MLAENRILKFCLHRWVDDIFAVYIRDVTSQETAPNTLTDTQVYSNIFSHLKLVFSQFELKAEDDAICVGMRLECTEGDIHLPCHSRPLIQFTPSVASVYPHYHSNVPHHLLKGVIKGALIRTLDQTSSVAKCEEKC